MTVRDDTRTFFATAVHHNMNALYAVALRLTRNGADAEDLVAESVTRAWVAIDTLGDRTHFRSWVFRIQRNSFISGLRRRSVRPTETSVEDLQTDEGELDVASLLLDESDDFLAWWANPEHRVGNEILGQQIMDAIRELPAVFRSTVMLVNVDRLTYDEPAAVLGVPPGTVRSRMKRGRTLLQKALWQQARDAGLGGSDENDGDTT